MSSRGIADRPAHLVISENELVDGVAPEVAVNTCDNDRGAFRYCGGEGHLHGKRALDWFSGMGFKVEEPEECSTIEWIPRSIYSTTLHSQTIGRVDRVFIYTHIQQGPRAWL